MTMTASLLLLGVITAAPIGDLLGTILLVPVRLPPGGRLLSFLPLAFCIALVYRATRVREARDLLKGTVFTFLNIVFGMAAIAVAVYLLHQAVLRYF